jgi:hypothetical protein
LRILTPKKESKFGQNNPENRQNLSYARGLIIRLNTKKTFEIRFPVFFAVNFSLTKKGMIEYKEFMRLLLILATLGTLGYGGWWLMTTHPDVKNQVTEWIDSGSFPTLEVRYTAEQIMNTHSQELLTDSSHVFLEPVLKFYPYLLLEVKYNISENQTGEGVILWDLTDGEMVIDTHNWEKTHGFGDCIQANTEKHEFKILNILAKKGGISDRETLSKALHVDNEILDGWIDSCRKKKLIVQAGNRYRLHLQNPKLRVSPETRVSDRLVTKPFKNAIRASRKFSAAQIQKITKCAFGNDFSIRNVTDLYLPVHSISVENPDGSTHTSHWNALNGQRLPQTHFIN